MQTPVPNQLVPDPETRSFYREALEILNQSDVQFLVAGAFAFTRFTNIKRYTKDLDIFVRPQDCQRILGILSEAGYQTELPSPHWLAKAFKNEDFIDVIFDSPSRHSPVDDGWFDRAKSEQVLGVPVFICSAEDLVWSKAFVMSRDRYDGADVAHLLLACADQLDWQHLIARFGDQYWRVFYSHLILFGFIYPGHSSRIPTWVMKTLGERLQQEIDHPPALDEKLCQGTLLAGLQYRIDTECWGYQDVRIHPLGNMTRQEVEDWTEALERHD